ncbi:MAG: dihydroorotase family protein [Patescibacteria group bacterium]
MPEKILFGIPKVRFNMHVHGRGMKQWPKVKVRQLMAEAKNGLIDIMAYMPNTDPAIISIVILKMYLKIIELAKKKLNIVYPQYVWFGVTDDNLAECEEALKLDGVIGLKIYPKLPGGKSVTTGSGEIGVAFESTIKKAMELCKKYNKPIAIHCDDPALIQSYGGNPIIAEYSYVDKVLNIAREVPGVIIIVCHVSCIQSARKILKAQEEGMQVVIELCTHYLWFDNEGTNWNPNLGSAFYLCLNNLRGPEHREFLVGLLATDNPLIIISTDDAWHLEEEKLSAKPPSGIPSIREMVSAIVTLAIQHGISEQRVYQLLSGNPSKIFNIPVSRELVEYEWELREDDILYNGGKGENVVNPWNKSKLYVPVRRAS